MWGDVGRYREIYLASRRLKPKPKPNLSLSLSLSLSLPLSLTLSLTLALTPTQVSGLQLFDTVSEQLHEVGPLADPNPNPNQVGPLADVFVTQRGVTCEALK